MHEVDNSEFSFPDACAEKVQAGVDCEDGHIQYLTHEASFI